MIIAEAAIIVEVPAPFAKDIMITNRFMILGANCANSNTVAKLKLLQIKFIKVRPTEVWIPFLRNLAFELWKGRPQSQLPIHLVQVMLALAEVFGVYSSPFLDLDNFSLTPFLF